MELLLTKRQHAPLQGRAAFLSSPKASFAAPVSKTLLASTDSSRADLHLEPNLFKPYTAKAGPTLNLREIPSKWSFPSRNANMPPCKEERPFYHWAPGPTELEPRCSLSSSSFSIFARASESCWQPSAPRRCSIGDSISQKRLAMTTDVFALLEAPTAGRPDSLLHVSETQVLLADQKHRKPNKSLSASTS